MAMKLSKSHRHGLHLRSAYAFGIEKGLPNEVKQIRQLKIDQPMNGALISLLLESEGIYEDFINLRWIDGQTDDGRTSIRKDRKKLAIHYMDTITSQDNEKKQFKDETVWDHAIQPTTVYDHF